MCVCIVAPMPILLPGLAGAFWPSPKQKASVASMLIARSECCSQGEANGEERSLNGVRGKKKQRMAFFGGDGVSGFLKVFDSFSAEGPPCSRKQNNCTCASIERL